MHWWATNISNSRFVCLKVDVLVLFMDSQQREAHQALNVCQTGYLDLRRRQIKATATSNNRSVAETDTPTMIPD